MVHTLREVISFNASISNNTWHNLCLFYTGASTPTATPPGTPGRRSFSIHVPTQSSLTLPIRRYISGTLITHVLGQPSFSLATFLISANTQYLGIELPSKQITLEDVCKLANDHYQNVLPMSVITHARSLFSQHDVAWRESDRARRIATNLENCKLALHRAKSIATRFQVSVCVCYVIITDHYWGSLHVYSNKSEDIFKNCYK